MTDRSALRDAATILLIRRDGPSASVLMGMRGAKAAFMPSKYVFPGGAVDPEDGTVELASLPAETSLRRLALEPLPESRATPLALAACALRELAEETGLLLGRPGKSAMQGYRDAGLTPDAAALTYVFRAITPPGRPRRFDTRFFVADAALLDGDPDDFSRACDELSHLHWVKLSEARDLNLPFITEVVLTEVAALVAATPQGAMLDPETVPFFDNRGSTPRFLQIA